MTLLHSRDTLVYVSGADYRIEFNAWLQEYLAESGVPYVLLLTSAFYDNLINFTPYQKQPDGSFSFSDNLGTEPHSWHSVDTIGLTAAGEQVKSDKPHVFLQDVLHAAQYLQKTPPSISLSVMFDMLNAQF